MVQAVASAKFSTHYNFFETDKKINERELVNMLKRNCNKTFTYLYNNYSSTLYGVILEFIDDKNLANDILQDVFINIHTKMASYDASKSRLYTWMLSITRHLCIDTMRSKSYRNALKNVTILDDNQSFPINVVSQFDNIGLHKLLDRIKPAYKKIIELSYYKGYSQEEIAHLLQLPLGTVKTRIKAGLVQLRLQMATNL